VGVLLALALSACGGSGSDTTAAGTGSGGSTGSGGASSKLTATALTPSLGAAARVLETRNGSVLRRSLDESLGKDATISIAPGTAVCRTGAQTASVTNPKRYPFACIISGRARGGGGVTTGFVLGFVVFHVNGLCWRASNERIAAAASGPVLLPRQQALEPANVISGCVGGAGGGTGGKSL
jgi:hypothetical protein